MNTLQAILRFLANNPQFIIVLVIVGAPILKAILKTLEDQKQKRAQLAARRRLEDEMLRTGRMPQQMPSGGVTPEVSARERLEELAARRRAMIEDASRQPQAPQQAPSRPATVPGQMTQVRLPGGIVIEVPAELVPPEGLPGRTSPPPRPQPQPTPASQSPRPARAQGPRPQQRPQPQRAQPQQRPAQRAAQRPSRGPAPPPSQPMAPRRQRADAEQPEDIMRASAMQSKAPEPAQGYDPTQRTSAARGSMLKMPTTREEWRRAILLREILGTPVGMRRT